MFNTDRVRETARTILAALAQGQAERGQSVAKLHITLAVDAAEELEEELARRVKNADTTEVPE